jgi:hypothetical protein
MMATSHGSPAFRRWNIFAIRALIFGAFLVEGSPSLLVTVPFLYQALLEVFGEDIGVTLFATGLLSTLFLFAAQCSFMLAIRVTQQLARDSVSAREWGISGFLSANLIQTVGTLLITNVTNQEAPGASGLALLFNQTGLQHLAVFFVVLLADFFFCLFIDRLDRSDYKPSWSVTVLATENEKSSIASATPIPDLLGGIRDLLDAVSFHDIATALVVVKRIPGACPFERSIEWRGKLLLTIPPLCKLNPLFPEIQGLRYRALSYLAEEGVDVSSYL